MELYAIIEKPYGWVEYLYKCPDCGGIKKVRNRKNTAHEIKLNPVCETCENRIEHELEMLYNTEFYKKGAVL